MHNIYNNSPWQASLVENWQQDKQKCVTLVLKQSFEYNDKGDVFAMPNSDEIVVADEMLADPTASTLIEANETMPFKQGFEWYGNLRAYPPKGKQVKVIEVNVALHQAQSLVMSKTLRVTGQRVWRSSLLGSKASAPLALGPTALNYEHAYGGIDANKPDNVYPQNPAGIGYRVKQTKGAALPLVEYPGNVLTHPKSHVSPASYAPIPQFWQPRLDHLPDIDTVALMASEYPYKSALKSNMHQYAPIDQQANIEFDDNMVLSLKGVSPNKHYQDETHIQLPYMPPKVALGLSENDDINNKSKQSLLALCCDTLVLNADANVFHLIWRKSLNINDVSPHHYVLIEQGLNND